VTSESCHVSVIIFQILQMATAGTNDFHNRPMYHSYDSSSTAELAAAKMKIENLTAEVQNTTSSCVYFALNVIILPTDLRPTALLFNAGCNEQVFSRKS